MSRQTENRGGISLKIDEVASACVSFLHEFVSGRRLLALACVPLACVLLGSFQA
jgi:hypothetical protein